MFSKSPVTSFRVWLKKAGDENWTNEAVPARDTSETITDDDMYDGRLDLQGLQEGSMYQVIVQTTNTFGTTNGGMVFTFYTKDRGESKD